MEAILLQRRVARWRQRRITLSRKILRDYSNPMSMDDKLFVRQYRIKKELFLFLCNVLADKLSIFLRSSAIPSQLKILSTLSFLATGSYQKLVGQDWLTPLSQASISRCIGEVVEALNQVMPTFINFPSTVEERNKIKKGFFERYHFSGVLGCIDGTLISIVAPRDPNIEAAFFSRKGYHAINAAIICDSTLRIRGICAKFGGATHDSYVWQSWAVNHYLQTLAQSGEVGWLLGDSGYPQRPWLMTPILHAAENTPEAHYTKMHVHTRVCIEQCIGLLKARWRCLLRHRVLHYEPTKCAKIINACAVLHNLCLNDDFGTDFETSEEEQQVTPEIIFPMSLADSTARQQLINILAQTL